MRSIPSKLTFFPFLPAATSTSRRSTSGRRLSLPLPTGSPRANCERLAPTYARELELQLIAVVARPRRYLQYQVKAPCSRSPRIRIRSIVHDHDDNQLSSIFSLARTTVMTCLFARPAILRPRSKIHTPPRAPCDGLLHSKALIVSVPSGPRDERDEQMVLLTQK